MNNYHIIYIGADGEPKDTQVIERSEAAARKTFKQSHKANDIMSVEIAEENVPATKDQEREALAKIKQMVEELGPQSYIGTAFEGCWQDAEDNIEYDYGCSMKQKLESAEFAEDQLREKLAEAEERTKEQHRYITELEEERSALETKLAEQTLPEWLLTDIHALLAEESTTARKRMEIAAENMATFADEPQGCSFTGSVDSYRKAKEQRERCAKILSGLEAVKQEEAGI